MPTHRAKRLNDSAGSLTRAQIILSAIAEGPQYGASIGELHRRTLLPRSTIYRVVDQLLGSGWLLRGEDGRLNLGPGLMAMGVCAASRFPLERVAAGDLGRLAERLDQVVYLDVRNGLDTICVGRYDGHSHIQVSRGWIGMRVPLGATPGGMAMLARLPRHEADEIVTSNMVRLRSIEGFDEPGFFDALKASNAAGCGLYDTIILDRKMCGCAVAICDSSSYPIASIGVTFLKDWRTERREKECLAALSKHAALIETRIASLIKR